MFNSTAIQKLHEWGTTVGKFQPLCTQKNLFLFLLNHSENGKLVWYYIGLFNKNKKRFFCSMWNFKILY